MGQHKTSIHWERDTEHFNIKSFVYKKVVVMRNSTSDYHLVDLQTPAKYLTDKPWVQYVS